MAIAEKNVELENALTLLRAEHAVALRELGANTAADLRVIDEQGKQTESEEDDD